MDEPRLRTEDPPRDDPPQMRRVYWRFYRAARRGQVETVVRLVREFPGIHRYEGPAGGLVDILDRKAPELLEPAFEAGLSPDAALWTEVQSAAAVGRRRRRPRPVAAPHPLRRRSGAAKPGRGSRPGLRLFLGTVGGS